MPRAVSACHASNSTGPDVASTPSGAKMPPSLNATAAPMWAAPTTTRPQPIHAAMGRHRMMTKPKVPDIRAADPTAA